ncbi:hypothetical protein D3C87_1377690 [compost metagenome]
MKSLFSLLILVLVSFNLNAQITDIEFNKLKIPVIDAVITYTAIDTIPNYTKEQLQSGLREWIAKNFVSANNVIQMDDKEAGKIIVKGKNKEFYNFNHLGKIVPINYYQSFIIDMTVKESRYRVKIYGFQLESAFNRAQLYTTLPVLQPELEKIYWNIPSTYDFTKLNRREKQDLVIKRQVLKTVDDFALNMILSVKNFMRNNLSNTKKEDDF